MPRIRVRSAELALVMLLFAIAGFAFLLLIGRDALAGNNSFQFFADSGTYLQMFADGLSGGDSGLLSISDNFVGPLLVLKLLGGNIYLVMLLNIYLFCHSILHITARLNINPLKVGALLLLSPMTVSTLLSVNKEIFVFPFIALALTAYLRRSITYVFLALVVSVLVRWQVTAFFVVMLAISISLGLVKRRGVALAMLLIACSVVYVRSLDLLGPVIANVELSIAEYEGGSGLYAALLGYQQHGFYFLVFPIKAMQLLFGMGLRLDRLFNPSNIYNDVFVVLHCAATLVVFVMLLWRRLFRLRSDLIFASIIFLAVLCLTPVFAPRYLYPVYVAWVLALAGAPMSLIPSKKMTQRDPMLEPDHNAVSRA